VNSGGIEPLMRSRGNGMACVGERMKDAPRYLFALLM
jgi:hypothetical protein